MMESETFAMRALNESALKKIAKMEAKAEKNLAHARKQMATHAPGHPVYALAELLAVQSEEFLQKIREDRARDGDGR
jgi:hypothetical protein